MFYKRIENPTDTDIFKIFKEVLDQCPRQGAGDGMFNVECGNLIGVIPNIVQYYPFGEQINIWILGMDNASISIFELPDTMIEAIYMQICRYHGVGGDIIIVGDGDYVVRK